jgi:hypothetical protein
MTSIGGPGGIGGPKGPSAAGGPDAAESTDAIAGDAGIERATATGHAPDIEALSAEVAAGRLTAREAIDRLVDATATAEMDPADRAELREMLSELVANDPYLGALATRA